jgi:acyl carrier protein
MGIWSPDEQGHPPIGHPIYNAQVYVLDAHLQPVPVGVTGEIYIGGLGVTRGHLHNPALTAEKFMPDPFMPNGRLYKTGDLGRYLPDGRIEFIGRVDHQVKINGFRIEIGEIEATMRRSTAVKEAVILSDGRTGSSAQLVAFLSPIDKISFTVEEVRQFLKDRLPHYMIPARFVVLDALPLTANNKIDRQALITELAAQTAAKTADFVPAQTRLEQMVAAIWQDVLRVEPVSINDNFFELGGHSLAMAAVHDRLQTALKKEIPIVTLFEQPTIRTLANYLNHEQANSLSFTEHEERAQKQRASRRKRRQRN